MEFDFKKAFIWIIVIAGILVFINSRYSLDDALTYSKTHPDPKVAPAIDFYVGSLQYMRSEYPKALVAYEQMLTEYPTCQYAPKALLRVGSIYQERNEFSKAKDAYAKYIEQFPTGDNIEIVKKKFEFVQFK
ncbi:MAG: tetratricopeptide repeat protein [Elusimicrobiota bacterium]